HMIIAAAMTVIVPMSPNARIIEHVTDNLARADYLFGRSLGRYSG
ncbi:unnamed protein product, partial [marine sediment metagenome]